MKKILYIMTLILIISCGKELELESTPIVEKEVRVWVKDMDEKDFPKITITDDDGMIYIDKENFVELVSIVENFDLIEAIEDKIKFRTSDYEMIIDFEEKNIKKKLLEVERQDKNHREIDIVKEYALYDRKFLIDSDICELNYMENKVLIYDIAMFTNMNFQRDSKELSEIYFTRYILPKPILMSKNSNEYSYTILEEYMRELINLDLLKKESLEKLQERKEKFIKNFYKEMNQLTRDIKSGHFGMISIVEKSNNINNANKINSLYKYEDMLEVKTLNEDTAYLKINTFHLSEYKFDEIEEAMNNVYEYKNLIIDVRNNTGGVIDNRRYLESLLTNEEIEENYITQYGKIQMKLPILSTKKYQGNLVVLANKISYSASTMFVNNIKENNLGIIIGEKTDGGADSQNEMVLPNGVKIAKSLMRVASTKDFKSIETGIVPDILINDIATKKDRDPILTGALEYLSNLQ